MVTSLVTGGSGFLGSHICERLIAAGHRVLCLDNLLTGRYSNIEHLTSDKRFQFIEGSVTEHISISENLDNVLHFASPASPTDYAGNPIHTLKVGAIGTLNALGLARSKCAKFCLASTSEIYGTPLESPQKETYWGNVNPVGPRSVYDEAKRFAESITMAYHREHGVDTRIIRIFNTYGPRMRPDDGRAIPSFIVQALMNKPFIVHGDGSQTRSFCYVDDLVDGLYKFLNMTESSLDANSARVINIGGTEEITILRLAEIVKEVSLSKSDVVFRELPEDDPLTRRPDITRASKVLGWRPTTDFKEGLSKTVEFLKSEPRSLSS